MIDPATGKDDGKGRYGHGIGSVVSINQQMYPPFWKITGWEKDTAGYDIAVLESMSVHPTPERREPAFRLFKP